jgi:YidC/Oxa1 family membrane protein insertase
MSVKSSPKKIKSIERKFSSNNNFSLEIDFPNFDSFLVSDVMISDWSGIALEFAFVIEKPVLYIDVPKKIHNPDFHDIPEIPIEISIRDKIGKIILPSNIDQIPTEIENLKEKSSEIKEVIRTIRNGKIFNVGNSEKSAAKSVIELLNKSKNN